jgi:NADH dehydrogenase/NADH:ubiquinone oxidoreductase subunit G
LSAATAIVKLTIDGRPVDAAPGSTVLDAARRAGIDIPTLCHHPDLEPVGACRLCAVEVTHPDWRGWTGLMVACLYPVAEGIRVETQSAKVRDARRQVLALLAARCPGSKAIGELAARYGADTAALRVTPDADTCILCGLCTRVCDAFATSAITTHGRGSAKAVGPFAGQPPEECVGCGACALVCPTGHIVGKRTASGYEIWGRSFDTDVCAVDQDRCSGCGVCEELCPFSVARVGLRPGGERVASIPAEHCRGCGVCVGACPTGAIDQRGQPWRALTAPAAPRTGGDS